MSPRISIWLGLLATMVVACSAGTTPPQQLPDVDATVAAGVAATQETRAAIDATVVAAVAATQEAAPTATAIPGVTPVAVPSPVPTAMPAPTPTVTPLPTATAAPEPTAAPTPTPQPTATPRPSPTSTAIPTPTPTSIPTVESLPDLVVRIGPAVVRILTNLASGSGVIVEIDPSTNAALILTNFHVIEGGSFIDVAVAGSGTFRADVLGTDPARDLAVLRICCDEGYTSLSIAATAAIRTGEVVVVAGFPLGVTTLRISEGIVSGLLYDQTIDRYEVQTDAAINPGNSGGPLLLRDGTIAGINTYKVLLSSGDVPVEGFGFAISARTLSVHFPRLKDGQSVAVPTATPVPHISAGIYTSPNFGYMLDIPAGWDFDDSTPDRTVTWDPNTLAWIRVRVESVDRNQYPNTAAYTADWTVAPAATWTDYVVTSEDPGIFRSTTTGSALVSGHEFNFVFRNDEGELFDASTHWFVLDGRLYWVNRGAPQAIRGLDQYAELDRKIRLAHVSFKPPGS